MSGVKQFAPFKKIDTSIEPKVIGDGLNSTPLGQTTPAAVGATEVNTDKIIETVKQHGTISSGTEDFDLDNGAYHVVTVGGNFIVTFSNWITSGEVVHITMELINAGAHTITWPATVDWPAGTEPSWTAAGTDFAILFSRDGGTTIFGKRSMTDVK